MDPFNNYVHHHSKTVAIRPLLLLLIFLAAAGCATDRNLFTFDEFTYSGNSLDISTETENARATTWRSDGSQIYVTGRYTENVASYTLTEPWELSTATFSSEFDLSNEFGSTSQNSVAHGLFIHEDGELMWVFNRTEMWGYTLSEPWELTSTEQSYFVDLSEFVQRGHDFDFNPDGTRLFIDDRDAQSVHEVHLSTPWDITTMEWSYTLDISDQEKEVRGLEMVSGGRIMLLLDTVRKEVLRYRLEEPYELRTARFLDTFYVGGQTDDPRGLSVHPALESFYITGRDRQAIYQYSRP
ncbi:hypothetical protein DYD21_01720 [Rhodohalobacter sp. SW132]|uniref:hypothetical protein n=1 Tax=Rhodohalobacter sp. SW132 TaxID=2293433 RepID=UPI000E267A78|nr:hypothetical protein [Rhodohalobacter sp. SW132]REL38694.1 hypothetical protein DYD21_01720 [Rhodohalobacter sp. SW132]